MERTRSASVGSRADSICRASRAVIVVTLIRQLLASLVYYVEHVWKWDRGE